jgi:hypothetical protein
MNALNPPRRHQSKNTRAGLAPAADRGTDGPAMMARPHATVTIEDDTAAEDGTRQFTRTEVRRYSDGLLDMLAETGRLAGRRLEAAADLARLYHDGRHASCGFASSGHHGGGEMSDERAEAWGAYCRALDALPVRCQETCADIASGRFPTRHNWMAEAQDGFKVLADLWRKQPDRQQADR